MPYSRFDDLRRFLCFGSRTRQDSNAASPQNRWELCEGLMNSINEHRQERATPSHVLCVDESMSRWYGRGGEWISVGLPHYVSMDSKPEAGCEIQNIACGRSGLMLGMSFVRSAIVGAAKCTPATLNHGTRVLMDLCAPWTGTGRIGCADSYFASVQAACTLYDNGLRFTGVVKTSTKKYPMEYLSNFEMSGRGDHTSMVAECKSAGTVNYKIFAFGWVDRNRRYFVSTAGTTLPGNSAEGMRLREVQGGAQQVYLEVKIPEVVETYYSAASRIDRHNRCRQDDLNLENPVEVREWSFRVNCTLLSVCIVDSWHLYKCEREGRSNMKPHEYYGTLAEELIDNSFDRVGLRERNSPLDATSAASKEQATSGAYEHPTPTKKRRKLNGKITSYRMQQRCCICGLKTTYVCSTCDDENEKQVYFCHSSKGRTCYRFHLMEKHDRVGC